ncbi:MAG: class I SAM-dependent methyltransferase [Atribacterota bacterium]|nr:class I SAM-dependent methyltransferase [Atribacterota bacterium]
MILKWSKKLTENNVGCKSLKAEDFAKSFGVDKKEIIDFCGGILTKLNFKYYICSLKNRERIFLDIIKKCDSQSFSVSGCHRQNDWSRGWGEILQEFKESGGDLKLLIPKDIHGDRPLRYDGNYIISDSDHFEWDFSSVFRTWLFKKYFINYRNVYEFGCGSGHNLMLLAGIFPDKKFFGLDWAIESKKILEIVSKKYGWEMAGFQFDFFSPDYGIDILPSSVVYTSAALEQLGGDYKKFIDYLLVKKPELCVNVECLNEYYDQENLFDYVALKYHKTRNYLDGFLTYLRGLEKSGKIKIIATKRLGFGSLYHEVFSYIIWKIL